MHSDSRAVLASKATATGRWLSLQGSQGGSTFDRTRSGPRTHASVDISWGVGSCSLCRRPRRSPAFARRKAGWAAGSRWRTHTDGRPTRTLGQSLSAIPALCAVVRPATACPSRKICCTCTRARACAAAKRDAPEAIGRQRACARSGGRAVPAKPSPAAPPARAVAACRSGLSFRRAPDRYPRPKTNPHPYSRMGVWG